MLQAQHQGLMAMMNALDGSPSSVPGHSVPADTSVDHAAKLSRPQSRHKTKKSIQHRERKDAVDASSDLLTDLSVTPVPSEDRSLSPNPPETAVSKDHSDGRRLPQNGSTVRGALAELQQLRGSFDNRRILRVPPPSANAVSVGKENRPGQPSMPDRRPFAALLDSLRRMNPELGAGRGRFTSTAASSAPFQLLRLPSPEMYDYSVKFPSVVFPPRVAWESTNQRPAPEEYWQMPAVNEQPRQTDEVRQLPPSVDDLPLLRLSENRFPSRAVFSNGLPFPMLQMADPRRKPVPFFVPPEHIVGQNNNNREMLTAKFDVQTGRMDIPSARPDMQTGRLDIQIARSGVQTARSEPPTGQSGNGSISQQSVELLKLQPCLSEASDDLESDSRQVLETICIFRCQKLTRVLQNFG